LYTEGVDEGTLTVVVVAVEEDEEGACGSSSGNSMCVGCGVGGMGGPNTPSSLKEINACQTNGKECPSHTVGPLFSP
jgi:hypothetical protein